jgi:hypothetical protein
MKTSPEEGRSRQPTMASKVDFPDPEGPRIAANSPLSMVKETCFKTGRTTSPMR